MLRLKRIAATLAVLTLPLPLHLVGQASAAAGKRVRHTAARPAKQSGKHAKSSRPSKPAASVPATPTSAPPTALAPSTQRTSRRHFRLTLSTSIRAHAARDPADTISDYKFSPGSLTIHVGDTVTWTNNGPTAHTATASDRSFDTGILQKGHSASHTFTQAGTISYICTLHPFMHGTIVVLAATTSSHTGSSNTSSNPTTTGSNTTANTTNNSSTSTTNSSSGLPNTGLNLAASVLVALGLIGFGTALRRARRSSP